jgi:bacterioferritin (cytochrome b1)
VSLVYLKDNPKGVDKVVNDLNAQLFNDLTTSNGWDNYNAYHRAYKNPTQEGIIAEVFDKDDKDYKEVFFNDTLNASSFFVIDDTTNTTDLGRIFTQTVSIIFQVDLSAIAGSIETRADEEIIAQVVNSIQKNKFGDITAITRGIENVYTGFRTEQIQYTDMQPFFCFRIDVDVTYQYDCCEDCSYVIGDEGFLLTEMFGYLVYEDGGRIDITT